MSLERNNTAKGNEEQATNGYKKIDFLERVVLNVGGTRFETYVSTLISYPGTLLGTMFSERNRQMRRPDKNGEYFFDRNPSVFPIILHFYRTGKLLSTDNINEELLQDEFSYFQMPIEEEYGEVYTTGDGIFGQLGHGVRDCLSCPKVVDALQGCGITQLSLGGNHSAAIAVDDDNNTHVYTWGYARDGRLGHGHELNQLVPRKVEALEGINVTSIACGGAHTACLTASGEVYTWGIGMNAKLGHGDGANHYLPTRIESIVGLHIITQISCGRAHTALLTSEGNVLTFGDGLCGRLGHGNSEHQWSPKVISSFNHKMITQVECGGSHTLVLTSEGQVYVFGFSYKKDFCVPKVIEELREIKIVQVSCGQYHSAVLSDAGDVFTWGEYSSDSEWFNTIIFGSNVPIPGVQGYKGGVKAISSGCEHMAVLSFDGQVFTWGQGSCGELGYDSTNKEGERAPKLVSSLVGHKIKQVVCGGLNTAFLTERKNPTTAFK